jgi:hypothetical protein
MEINKATSGAGTAYTSGALEFNQFICWICTTESLISVVFCRSMFSYGQILVRLLKPRPNLIPLAYIASTVRNEDTRDYFLINLGKILVI